MSAVEVKIDLSRLDEAQLALMMAITPEEVRQERFRRAAFPDMSEAMTALAKLHFEIETFISRTKRTAAVQELEKIGVTDLLQRILATATVKDIPYNRPAL